MTERRILISCGGLGMGNASRVFAIAQAILREWPGSEVHVFSWGRGLEFLRRASAEAGTNLQVHGLSPYPWAGVRKASPWGQLGLLARYLSAYARNTRVLAAAHARIAPSAVLLDSDYHFLAFLGRRSRLFYLGQAIDVVDRARRLGYRPKRLLAWASFFVCEVADGLLQRFLADRVFVPSFLEREEPAGAGRAFRVPLIVREEFRTAFTGQPSVKVAAVSSGSGIESERLERLVKELGASRIATPGTNGQHLTGPRDFLVAETVLVQGGLTSISECIALGKPMIVVPIRGRAEQEVNARTVELLGLGIACEEEHARAYPAAPATRPRILVHGAEVVARNVFAEA